MNPLAEIFGFPCANDSEEALRHTRERLCPFNNLVAVCTKDKATDPLGVCSIVHNQTPTIICPVRFRQDWLIARHAAEFFFGPDAPWVRLSEVRIREASGKSAGNIDMVLVRHDDSGRVVDYGALEVQSVYISGNVRRPFEAFVALTVNERKNFDWSGQPNSPHPDFLSSSRKRLVPQLIFKGKILQAWGRKCAVAIDEPFFDTLPPITEVPPDEAQLAWFVYRLVPNDHGRQYHLELARTVYTVFDQALAEVATPRVGDEQGFLGVLQKKTIAQLGGGL